MALCLREVDSLFSAFEHRKLRLNSRLVMAPLPRLLAQNGVPTPEMLDYYRRRAGNRVGLIITEPVAVNDPVAAADSGMAHFYGGAALRAWKGICRAVHAAGCRIAPQLCHAGMLRPASGDMPNPDAAAIGPSGIDPESMEERGEAMSRERIRSVVSAFADAAALSRLIGFDAVEINGGHAYLIDQFLRTSTNRRADEYGGDMRSRCRFACQIVHAVRKAVGRKFPIIFRFSQFNAFEPSVPLFQTPAELDEMLQQMCEAGVDMFACSGIAQPAFHGNALSLAAWTRLLSKKPVIGGGGVGVRAGAGDFISRIMRAREVDLLAVGRALLADAAWGSKIHAAAEEDIRPCTQRSFMHLF